MLWNFEAAEVYNVKDLYTQAQTSDTELLSAYIPSLVPEEDFWKEYRDNYNFFDRYFMKKYSSLIPFDQDKDKTLSQILTEWRTDVYSLLLANKKRYTELFRVNSIPDDDAYSLVNNVDYTETTERDVTFNKGRQVNELDGETNYGQQVVDDDKEFNYNTTNTQGSTTTNSTSAYNDSGYTATDKSETDINGFTDTQDNSVTYGSHKDERDDEYTEGAREDTTDEDITVHKVGNMGIQTVNDNLMKQINVWENFKFYDIIFEDIAKNLLRGC